MTCNLYDDVKVVNDAVNELYEMIEMLEKECVLRDKGKTATELFIRINSMKREMEKMVSESEWMIRRADIDFYGPLSKYVRPYLPY